MYDLRTGETVRCLQSGHLASVVRYIGKDSELAVLLRYKDGGESAIHTRKVERIMWDEAYHAYNVELREGSAFSMQYHLKYTRMATAEDYSAFWKGE
jgi:hypothetical protein